MIEYVTLSAKAKLHQLINSAGAACAKLTAGELGGFGIELPSDVDGSIILNTTPRITTDIVTFRKLSEGSVNFDYRSNDFIIEGVR
jgi:hypothetical protein